MKIEISIFNEEEQYYDHYGYYDSVSEAISELIQIHLQESFTEEQLKELFKEYETENKIFEERRKDK
jgi:hypothetical protein